MSTELIQVPFHGGIIEAIEHQGEHYVVVRRICENLGMHLQAQHEKLKEKPWAVIRMIRTPGPDGKEYEALCLSLRSLPMWLASINTSKVRAELRPALELYQREAADVLYRRFLERHPEPDAAVLRKLDELEQRFRALEAGPTACIEEAAARHYLRRIETIAVYRAAISKLPLRALRRREEMDLRAAVGLPSDVPFRLLSVTLVPRLEQELWRRERGARKDALAIGRERQQELLP